MLMLGASFLAIGVFVGRPYCRYLCPYGVIVGWVSRASRWHVTITPGECIKCRLCEDSCPFGAIQKPTQHQAARNRSQGKRRLAVLMGVLPVLMGLGILIGILIGTPLSRIDPTVRLAEQVWLEDTGAVKEETEASDAFRRIGRPSEELYKEALILDRKFSIGGGIFGAFLGLTLGIKVIQLSVRRSREDYETNRTTCLSCGRCFSYCPVGREIGVKRKM